MKLRHQLVDISVIGVAVLTLPFSVVRTATFLLAKHLKSVREGFETWTDCKNNFGAGSALTVAVDTDPILCRTNYLGQHAEIR
jgi:hypothetical protein